MFSGIVEEAATVVGCTRRDGNLDLRVKCSFCDELRIDQSVAHNGVCLTVVELHGDGSYTVTAVRETLERSNLGLLKPGDLINLERSMKVEGRLDGHIVQGHVDTTAFRVAIIPYTHEHTNFKEITAGTRVNLEFDIIGKYIARISVLLG